MKNTKTTKRALVSSIVALVLCFTMLLGTTYAWFTDSATSEGNIIKSGTLDVTMEWKDATATGAQQTYKDASEGAIFNYDKWEPGYVEAKNVRISNVGTLALKYQLAIVATGEVSKLADVIDVYYAEGEITLVDREMTELTKLGTLTDVLAKMSETANGDLLKGETDVVTIALKMQETANNDYQGLSIGSEFAVKCFATQLTSEKDSIDDQYDAMATIDTEAELLEALAADYDLIELGASFALTNSVVIPADKTVTIDLKGYTMSQVNAQQTSAYAMIFNKGNLTIMDSVGTGKISYTDTTPYTTDPGWASNTIRNEGTLTINGGTVENLTPEEVKNYGYPHAIDAYQGSVTTINGGTVKSLNYDSIRMFCNSETLATKVVINGGTIVNRVSFQDPQSTRAGYGILEINGGNFVTMNGVTANVRLLNFCKNCNNMKATVTGGTFDKGFKTQDLGGSGITTSDWLNMGTGVVVTTATELQAALNSATAGQINYINFAANITGDVVASQPGDADLDVVINGFGYKYDGTIKVMGNSGFSGVDNDSLVIKNINFETSNKTSANGLDAFIWSNDSSNGSMVRYAHNVRVENCTFTAVAGSEAQHAFVGVKVQQAYNISVVNCIATNMHSLMQAESCGTESVIISVDGCKVVNGKNGVSFNNTYNAVIKNTEIESVADGGYGIRHKGEVNNYALSVEKCTVKAFVPVLIRNMTASGYTATFTGENTLTATNDFGYEVVVSAKDWDNDAATPSAPTGSYTLVGADNFVKNID